MPLPLNVVAKVPSVPEKPDNDSTPAVAPLVATPAAEFRQLSLERLSPRTRERSGVERLALQDPLLRQQRLPVWEATKERRRGGLDGGEARPHLGPQLLTRERDRGRTQRQRDEGEHGSESEARRARGKVPTWLMRWGLAQPPVAPLQPGEAGAGPHS